MSSYKRGEYNKILRATTEFNGFKMLSRSHTENGYELKLPRGYRIYYLRSAGVEDFSGTKIPVFEYTGHDKK